MNVFRMIFLQILIGLFVNVFAMDDSARGTLNGSGNATSQSEPREVSAEEVIHMLRALGLRIKDAAGSKVRDAGTQTDPILERLYEPVFSSSFPSTERKTEEKLLELIRNEKKGISASLYAFNSYAIAYELCRKYHEGVDVRLILNKGCPTSTALLLLQYCTIPIKFCSVPAKGMLHQKVFRFDANTGKRALLDRQHKKDKLILEAFDRLNVSNSPSDKKLLEDYNNALNREVTFYWDGSFNITGAADQRNIESTTVVADDDAYENRKREFENLWSLSYVQKSYLDNLTFSPIELRSNGVPSKNAFYLLKSKMKTYGQYGLPLASLLGYKDFVPKNFAGDTPERELIPSSVELPFPCYIRIIHTDSQDKVEIKHNDGSWIALKDALERFQQVQVTNPQLKLRGVGEPVEAEMDTRRPSLVGVLKECK